MTDKKKDKADIISVDVSYEELRDVGVVQTTIVSNDANIAVSTTFIPDSKLKDTPDGPIVVKR